MKKIWTKLIASVLALSLIATGLIACDNGGWEGTSLKNPGEIVSVNSFVAQSENYVYYINGIGDSSADNTFGTPIKGALVATDGTKTEVVVPKLFVASNYNQGLFIYEDYVYYGTPNVEKNSAGNIAKDELTFMRTKLDGSKTDEYFSVSGISTEYMIVEEGGVVYIVYYDIDSSAIICYNTSTKSASEVAKTDAKTSEMETLAAYKFLYNSTPSVIYTTTVYSEEYNADKEADSDNYQRATENYNKVYTYTPGGEATLVFDGEKTDAYVDDTTYEIKKAVNQKDGNVSIIYTQKAVEDSVAKTFIAPLNNMSDGVEVVNDAYVNDSSFILDAENVYFVENGKLIKSTLIAKDNESKQVIAVTDNVNKIIDVHGDYVYYFNVSNQIARLGVNDSTWTEERVSEGTVATTWYTPEIITLKGEEVFVYADTTTTGSSYLKYVALNATVDFEDADDDGEFDEGEVKFLTGHKDLSKKTLAGQASEMNAKISKLASSFENGAIVFERVEEGDKVTLKFEELVQIRAEYDALSQQVKDKVSTVAKENLVKYEKAVKLANLYVQVEDVINYETMSDTQKADLEATYKSIKAQVEKLSTTAVNGVIETNLKYFYQECQKLFEAK